MYLQRYINRLSELCSKTRSSLNVKCKHISRYLFKPIILSHFQLLNISLETLTEIGNLDVLVCINLPFKHNIDAVGTP